MDCLHSAVPAELSLHQEPSEEIDLSSVPHEYYDLSPVFSKDHAQSLPPHRPYGCAINLLPVAFLLTKKLYNISVPERLAIEQYISEFLAEG